MQEPSYVREARLAQQRYERRIPVQLEIGGLMPDPPYDEDVPSDTLFGTKTERRVLFYRAHYNALAKEIRELFPVWLGDHMIDFDAKRLANAERAVLTTFALSLCKRLKEDNPHFDPIRFLEACSPDNDLYPLAELWDEDANE